jgi:CheY-like chemotaxis protein
LSKSILWLDNDLPYIQTYVNALKARDYDVSDVAHLTKAESLLAEKSFDLVIIDVMVPTQDAQEQTNYPEIQTDSGHMTGLVFYKRLREKFSDKAPPALVLTVRLDQEIRDAFVKAGLASQNFVTKYELRDVNDFLKKIKSLIG